MGSAPWKRFTSTAGDDKLARETINRDEDDNDKERIVCMRIVACVVNLELEVE